MIPLLSRRASVDVDALAIARGVPGLVLMENAGRGATEAIVERFGAHLGQVVLIGGPGQNGGDAWVIARQLLVRGVQPRAILIGDEAKLSGDAAINFKALRGHGGNVRACSPDDLSSLRDAFNDATLLVDGVFGTGLDREVRGGYAEVLQRMDACDAPLVSLDLPSGVDADTGRILGIAPHADLTVTFACHKRGLHQHPGAAHVGHLRLAHIGVPISVESSVSLLEEADIGAWLPPRAPSAHKGVAGHVLIMAGSPGRTGAAILSGRGAIRAGAGLVTLAARPDSWEQLDRKVTELMTAQAEGPEDVLALLEGKRALVMGPGLGLDDLGRELALRLGSEAPVPAVMDADALTAWADTGLEGLRSARAVRVLTPHPGEAARLLDCSVAEVQDDRYGAARELAEASGQIVVLKGAGTIIGSHKKLRVCGRGTPALGVAGTGDVLSGIIGALLGSLSAFDAASAAVWLHAVGGERAAAADRGLLAREVADQLPRVIGSLTLH